MSRVPNASPQHVARDVSAHAPALPSVARCSMCLHMCSFLMRRIRGAPSAAEPPARAGRPAWRLAGIPRRADASRLRARGPGRGVRSPTARYARCDVLRRTRGATHSPCHSFRRRGGMARSAGRMRRRPEPDQLTSTHERNVPMRCSCKFHAAARPGASGGSS